MAWIFLMIFAYLLGSIPTGVVVARLFGGQDPRKTGSGNIGATNVARTMGQLPGILTLAGDALKGLIPAAWAASAFESALAVALVGLAAFVGHLWPIFLGFKGGKGVATGLGVFLALATGPVVLAAVVFGAVVWRWRMVSLGSISAATAMPILCGLLGRPPAITLLAVAIAGLTVWKHWANIERIVSGTENKIDAMV